MAIVWKINSLDRDLTQGDNENIITQIHWTASDSDADGNTGSSYGSVGVTLVGTPTAYADVTEADANTTVDGFLAHEVQAVVPEAISGTKDALDADGNAVMQGIDQSKLVPLLVKTIQELEARITALENGE